MDYGSKNIIILDKNYNSIHSFVMDCNNWSTRQIDFKISIQLPM